MITMMMTNVCEMTVIVQENAQRYADKLFSSVHATTNDTIKQLTSQQYTEQHVEYCN